MRPKNSETKQLKTTCETAVEIDPDNGGEFHVTRYQRGILKQELRKARSAKGIIAILEKVATETERRWVENYCDRLRSDLAKKGLPDDRPAYWVSFDNGEWEPKIPNDPRMQGHPDVKSKHWMSFIDERTEPLSPERQTARTLQAFSNLLNEPRVDDYILSLFCDAMGAFANLRLGRVNAVASDGIQARKSLQLGPQARSRKASEQRKIVCEFAAKLWSRRPNLRGDASNTAQHILEEVNQALRSQGLLAINEPGLKAKTLADYIRAGLSEKIS